MTTLELPAHRGRIETVSVLQGRRRRIRVGILLLLILVVTFLVVGIYLGILEGNLPTSDWRFWIGPVFLLVALIGFGVVAGLARMHDRLLNREREIESN